MRKIGWRMAGVAGLLAAACLLVYLFPTWRTFFRRPIPESPITLRWVEQKAAEWKPPLPRPIETGCLLTSVSYGRISDRAFSRKVIAEDLDMLVQAHCSVIRIDLNYDPWLNGDAEGIRKYDDTVQMIRANGRKLMIADSAAESYRKKRKVNWVQFRKEWLARVAAIARRYRPDYYVVVKEPGWYWLMPSGLLLSQPWAKPDDWVTLTQRLVDAVKKISPETQTAVATPADSLYGGKGRDTLIAWFRAATKMPHLDIIGFDNYNARAFDDTLRFLDENGTGGKQFWLLEVWSHTKPTETPDEEPVDTAFIDAAIRFTQRFRGQGIVFFFTRYLVSYGKMPATEEALLQFFGGRTSVFYQMQRLLPQAEAPGRKEPSDGSGEAYR